MKPVYVIEWRPSKTDRWFREDMDEYPTLKRALDVALKSYANPEDYMTHKPPNVRVMKLVATVAKVVS